MNAPRQRPLRPPTDRQLEILASIARRRVVPSRREIAADLGLFSINGVNQHIAALVQKGLLLRDARLARSLVVTPLGETELRRCGANREGSGVVSAQISLFADVVEAPPALPAGPAPAYVTNVHNEAMRAPKPGFERAIVSILRGFAEYAQAHAEQYRSLLRDDGFLGDAWESALRHAEDLLNGETGRLDCGELSRQFQALRRSGGDELGVRAALDSTGQTSVPIKTAERPRRAARANKAPSVSEVPIGTKRLDERQRDLLRLIRVENNLAVYTGTETIPDWAALKSVMLTLGGKWKTKSGFVFPDELDAAELVRLAHETGEILDPKEAEFFETSDELADQLAAWVKPGRGTLILEPSAGRGAIVRAIRRVYDCCRVVAYEPLPAHVAALEEMGCAVIGPDFMQSIEPEVYDGVAMNPPFSKNQDIRHITKALGYLKPGGRLAAIASAGVLYRESNEHVAFRELVKSHGGTIVKNPDNSFAHAGTGVATVMVRLTKGGTSP